MLFYVYSKIIFFSIFVILSCCDKKLSKKTPYCEVLEYEVKNYHPTDVDTLAPFWNVNERIWYSDSFAIEEIKFLNILENGKGEETHSFPISHYRFTDLRKGIIYEYKTFNDTSRLIKKYSFNDSLQVVGGWGFNYRRNKQRDIKTELMKDTIIENINYKRLSFFWTQNGLKYGSIGFFRCDKKGGLFNLDIQVSNIVNCPVVELYVYPLQGSGLRMKNKINFIRNKFTDSELKVFETWKNNAR